MGVGEKEAPLRIADRGLFECVWSCVYLITEEEKDVKGSSSAEASTEVTEVGFYGGQGSMVLKSKHQSLSIGAL